MLNPVSIATLTALCALIPCLANAQDPTPAPQSAKRYLYDCDKGEKTTEAKAWRDHLAISKEAANWRSGGRWQPAFDKYMGKDSRSDPWYKAIRNAQKNQVSVHSSNWIFPQSWIYVYCKEKDDKSPYDKKKHCGDTTSGPWAYSFIVKGWFHNSYNIVFCPRYYQEKKEAKDIISAINSGSKSKTDALWMWYAYAETYYHEFMHFGDGLINATEYNGPMPDGSQPGQLATVAARFGAKGGWYYPGGQKVYFSTMYLPDAYATAATMTYFQEQLKLGDVPSANDAGSLETFSADGTVVLPDLDAHSPAFANANLPYDATKEDWSFQAQGLTDDNLPLLYPDSTISQADIDALFPADDQGSGDPTSTGPAQPVPTEWKGPNGPVKSGSFQFFVLPNYNQPKRRRSLLKRLVGPVQQPGVTIPIPQSARKPATIEVFIQDGDAYKKAGPLQIDCTKDQDAWQYFDPGQINTKYGLSIQSGHACSGIQSDNNLDNIHVKYGDAYVNIAGELGDGQRCSAHDGGASCVLPL